VPAIEVVDLMIHLAQANPARARQLEEWRNALSLHAMAREASGHTDDDPQAVGGGQWHWPDGTIWPARPSNEGLQRRLIWLPDPKLQALDNHFEAEILQTDVSTGATLTAEVLSLPRASGPRDIPMALCQALALHFGVPFWRDNVRDEVEALLARQPQLNLFNIGQLLSNLDLSVSLAEIPLAQLRRTPTPAVLEHDGRIAILEGVDTDGQLRLLEPEIGPVRVPLEEVLSEDADRLSLLLLRRRPDSKTQRFSWGWYGPFLRPHRRELIEVIATSAVVNVLALVTPLGIMRLINARTGGSDSLDAVISIGAILIGASVVAAIASALRSLIFTGVANRVDMDTRETILDRLVRLPQGFFDARPVGRITYYFNQLDRLRDFLIGRALTTLVDFSFSLLYLAVLFSLNPLLSLVTLSTVPLFIVLALIANPIVEHQIERVVQEGVNTNSYLTEAITGIQTIKSQNAELKTRWDFQDRYSRFIGEDFKLKVSGETVGALAKFLGDLTSIATMVVGVWLVSRNELTIGALFAFRIIGDRVTGPLVQLVQTWQQFKIQSRNLTLAADIVDRPTEQSEREAANIPMPPLTGEVEIEKVDFRYKEGGQTILHNVSLDVAAGTFVGLVGGSGSGKSTLLKLLPRFYAPESGRIKIDGLDISKVELYSLRRQIGVVPQDSLLFDGTIKENLLMVKPDATSEELIRAARIACAHDFIMDMPQGYNSPVGERGAGLSGGQRQRMALARAVLQNPRMLILDEATSALDATTERQVCLNLFDAFRGRTVFFITHRLSTVRPADLIVLMDQGVVMETGDHNALMQRQGWYYALVQSQAMEGLS
ncbi:MAG: multidrug ABC transporter, partial [Synechococcus sp. ARS1019]|nr:multidrug ABC transporter [Synechococcus sp. ARS1019]